MIPFLGGHPSQTVQTLRLERPDMARMNSPQPKPVSMPCMYTAELQRCGRRMRMTLPSGPGVVTHRVACDMPSCSLQP